VDGRLQRPGLDLRHQRADLDLRSLAPTPATAAWPIDHNGHGWIASNSPCGLVEIDGKSRTLVANHKLAQCSTPIGVSVDVDGYVWLVDQAAGPGRSTRSTCRRCSRSRAGQPLCL
jgi:streptogramin lyase